jgi:pimeloyl-ACP methyl ester carboxylesterase
VVRIVLVIVAAMVAASCAAAPDVRTVEADPAVADVMAPDTTRPSTVPPDEPPPSDDLPDGGSPDDTGPDADAAGPLDWGACSGAADFGPGLECATVTVPLDHDRPDGDTIEIAVARVTTANPDERIGSLLFNPGGPGGSGIQFLEAVAPVVPADLADRFDLVSFDPRGVGSSAAIDCDVDFDDEVLLLDAGDDQGWDELVADAEALADDCTPATLDLAPFVGTNNAARDLDVIREALGDDQLSYVGFSYGTRLGATYAELFPERVRALVLDGGVKPTDDLAEIGREQGPGFDVALERFAAACDADVDCPLGTDDVAPTLDVYAGLVEEIAEVGTFATDDGDRVLTPGELQLGVVAALYSTQLWPVLAEALFVADTLQDGSLLQVLADSYLGRQPDGTYDNSQVAGLAINCADDPRRPGLEEVRRQGESAGEASTYFGDLLRAGTGCVGTADPLDPIRIGPAEGAAPILVIGTTGDPATPYEWSVELAASLAAAELYTVEGDGHTAFLSIPCVDDVVIDYLVDLDLPDPGSGCAADTAEATDVFLPSGESELDQIVELFACLRDNGVDVPEITVGDVLADPNGDALLDGVDPTDPEFAAAVFACQEFVPDG